MGRNCRHIDTIFHRNFRVIERGRLTRIPAGSKLNLYITITGIVSRAKTAYLFTKNIIATPSWSTSIARRIATLRAIPNLMNTTCLMASNG